MIKSLLILSLLVLGIGGIAWRVAPGRSLLNITRNAIHFPTVSGYNLDRQEFVFPRDFAGELNIVFIAFLQEQQATVNTWLPFAQQVEADIPEVVYYELPTIDEMPAASRLFINEGMRAGIPDQTARERTVTLYIDTQQFMQATNIPDKNDVHTFLINRDGDILWRTTGTFNQEKGDDLLSVVQAHQ